MRSNAWTISRSRRAAGLTLGVALFACSAQAQSFNQNNNPSSAPAASQPGVGTGGINDTQTISLPDKMVLQAVIRDFKNKSATGGHPDFEAFSGTTTVGLVKPTLDADGKPVADNLRGRTITSEFTNKAGKNINPALYSAALGDHSGMLTTGSTSNGLTSAADFAQWYRDTPGKNLSMVVALTLNRVPNTNRYVFDSSTDEPYKSRGGFFPINGELFGNYSTTGKNFHFTTELETEFVYEKGTGQVFSFTGDDDIWVFVDGRLVIDLGGTHARKDQSIDIDRLDWLNDKQTYKLKVFHAERHTTQSNFRIETTMRLRSADLPATGGQFD